MNPGIHSQTPQLTVIEPRSLAVCSVGYYRSAITDPVDARINHSTYDPAGRMTAQRDPRLAKNVSAPANLTTVYSLSGKELSMISGDSGWRGILLNEANQLVYGWDGRGSQRRIEYDDQLRPQAVFERTRGEPSFCTERYDYGRADPACAAHNQCGRLMRHDDRAGTQLFTEFAMNGGLLAQTRHLLQELTPPNWPDPFADRDRLLEPGAGATSRSRFNTLGEVTENTDAKSNQQFFSQTVAGQLREVRLQRHKESTSTTLVSDIQYNEHGQTIREVAGNGVITTLEYGREDGRLIRLRAKRGTVALQDLGYEYDPVGNVLSIKDDAVPTRYFANQRIDAVNQYFYDSLYQLIRATGWEAGSPNKGPRFSTFDDPAPRGNYRQDYRYDRSGNLLELIHDGPQNHGHRLVAAPFSNRCLPVVEGVEPGEEDFRTGYDDNGNLLKLQPGQTLIWDLHNRLCEVRPVERDSATPDSERYIYGADGMRVRKVRSKQANARTVVAEVRYLPDLEIRTHPGTGGELHVITVNAGRSSVRVLHWDSPPPGKAANDQCRYSLNDHLGSRALELDRYGKVISQEWYHPFGTTAGFTGRGEVEASYKTVRYSGKERDTTGLYYYGFRYYVPWLQRWVNPDPAGSVDGLNLFCMVRNNPVNLQDFDGKQSNFKDLYNPARGDLIFGLAKVLDKGYLTWRAALTGRGDYLAKYIDGGDIAKLSDSLGSLRESYVSIRDATRFVYSEPSGGTSGHRENKFWGGHFDSISGLVFKLEEAYYGQIKNRYSGYFSTSVNAQFAPRFAAELAGTHYSVRNTFEKYVDAGDDKFNQKLVSRVSKAGLSTILKSDAADVIHFTLDELDMDQVIMKTRPSATSSELRYLYRNRDQLADKVLFYSGTKLVDAPWKSDRASWARYTPKSEAVGAFSAH